MSEKSTEVSRPTVMVVEDFDDTRFLIRFSLQRLGFRVVEAVNGRDAVELARRRCPDLVLMDLGLPVLDGIAATRLMREMEEMCGVPIVACTANSEPQVRAEALAAGCDDYVTKPINFRQLEKVITRLLGERARRGPEGDTGVVMATH